MKIRLLVAAVAILIAGVATVQATDRLSAATPDATLSIEQPPGRPVGSTLTWAANPRTEDRLSYRLSIKAPGERLRIMYDYSGKTEFEWTPMKEGFYTAILTVRNERDDTVTNSADTYWVRPRVTNSPRVMPTGHSLMALYSAPACGRGNEMRAVFRAALNPLDIQTTDWRPCDGRSTMNFYLAGMQEESSYRVWNQVRDASGEIIRQGVKRTHQTRSIAVDLPDVSTTPETPDFGSIAVREPILLHSPITSGEEGLAARPFATNLGGEVVWYYQSSFLPLPEFAYFPRPAEGGRLLLQMWGGPDDREGWFQREVDLAANVKRETNIGTVNEQLQAMGQEPVTGFHHEATRADNGHTLVLAATTRELPDVQGENSHILGDVIIALDENYRVAWAWDSFEHLDVSRAAILDEQCDDTKCAPHPDVEDPAKVNDWTHGNAIDYTPAGDLLFSSRHQDWVVKIDYDDGAGDGSVIWRLGKDGDFAIDSDDPWPWFSHQHDARYVKGTTDQIIIYDNGNTRCADDDAPDPCHSRGQVYQVDEEAMTANLVFNGDLENYSAALSAGEKLVNGNYHFTSGFQGDSGEFTDFGTSDELSPDGEIIHSIRAEGWQYRSFRMPNLYTP